MQNRNSIARSRLVKVDPIFHTTALHYCVDDFPGASIPGTRLQKILDSLQVNRPITQSSLDFLQQESLLTLHRLATCELDYDRFHDLALAEQKIRIEETKITQEATKPAMEAEKRARGVAAQERMKARASAIQENYRLANIRAESQARDFTQESLELAKAQDKERIRDVSAQEKIKRRNRYLQEMAMDLARSQEEIDPNYLNRIQNKELLAKYGINYFVEKSCFGRLMSILKRVDAGQRLDEQNFMWLSSVGVDYFSDPLRTAYHRLEADFFASEYRNTHDPWNAVNASSHYRKCDYAHKADALLGTINIEHQKSPKLKSAFYTTHGGVMRDMERRDEALRFGEKAHALQPNNFQPCTLLGAIHMDIGNYPLGKEWYDKAVERGATVDSVDKELRTIFARATPDKKREMGDFLLSVDPFRYDWVQKGKTHSQRATRAGNFPRQI